MRNIVGPSLGVLVALVIAGVALFPIAAIGILLGLNGHGSLGPFVLAVDIVVFAFALHRQFRRTLAKRNRPGPHQLGKS